MGPMDEKGRAMGTMEIELRNMVRTIMAWYELESNSILRAKLLAAKGYLDEAFDLKIAIEEERK